MGWLRPVVRDCMAAQLPPWPKPAPSLPHKAGVQGYPNTHPAYWSPPQSLLPGTLAYDICSDFQDQAGGCGLYSEGPRWLQLKQVSDR